MSTESPNSRAERMDALERRLEKAKTLPDVYAVRAEAASLLPDDEFAEFKARADHKIGRLLSGAI